MNHRGLIVVKPRERSVTYYDSLKKDGTRFLNATLEWLKHEAICKKELSLSEIFGKDWDMIEAGPNQPQREDDIECGGFVCINADCIADELMMSPRLYTSGADVYGHDLRTKLL